MSKNSARTARRKIEAVKFDGEIGLLSASELIDFPDNTWGFLRDRLTDGRRGVTGGLRAKCLMCGEAVFISTKRINSKPLPLFAHYRGGSKVCPWYHGPTLSPDTVRALQYQGRQESAAHRLICEQIDQLAQADDRYIKSTISKYIAPTENSYGRYPDVYVRWRNFPEFVVEIQLSKTFQTEISDRCAHYDREQIPLIWTMYNLDPRKDVLPQSFIDVVRRHRGNAFVIDQNSIKKSRETKTLCFSLYLRLKDGRFEGPRIVSMDDLDFSKGLPFLEDRIVAPLVEEIKERRRLIFKELEVFQDGWNWEKVKVVDRENLNKIFRSVSRSIPKFYFSDEDYNLNLLRLRPRFITLLRAA